MPKKAAPIPYEGGFKTYKEIAAITGRDEEWVRVRWHKGLPISVAAANRTRRGVREGDDRIPRTQRLGSDLTDCSLPYDEDKAALEANRYFIEKEPLHSAQEIAELMGCDLEDALLYREELRAWMFGSAPTLEVVGDISGLSRERVRQVQEQALERLRHPRLRTVLSVMREDANQLDRMRCTSSTGRRVRVRRAS